MHCICFFAVNISWIAQTVSKHWDLSREYIKVIVISLKNAVPVKCCSCYLVFISFGSVWNKYVSCKKFIWIMHGWINTTWLMDLLWNCYSNWFCKQHSIFLSGQQWEQTSGFMLLNYESSFVINSYKELISNIYARNTSLCWNVLLTFYLIFCVIQVRYELIGTGYTVGQEILSSGKVGVKAWC